MKYDIGRAARRDAARRDIAKIRDVRARGPTRTDVSFVPRERVSFGHHRLLVATIYTFCVRSGRIRDFDSTEAGSAPTLLEQCPDFLRAFPFFLRLRMRVHFATSVQRVQLNRTHAISATRLARRGRLDISRIRRAIRELRGIFKVS